MFAILLIVVIGIVAVTALAYSHNKDNLLREKQAKLEDFTETARNITQHYYEEAVAKRLSEEQAKSLALTAIEHMRYNQTEYVWVNDLNHNFVMHPTKPALNGTNAYNLADPDGVHLIRNGVSIARKDGQGFMRYRWSKPGTDRVEKKLSHVRIFKPWSWVFGSGLYLDDVQKELRTLAIELVLTGLVIMGVLLAGLVVVSQSISQPLAATIRRMQEIASGDGDLTVALSTEGEDEIATLGTQFNEFVRNIRGIMLEVGDSIDVLSRSAQVLNEASHHSAQNQSRQQSETDQVASAVHEMSTAAHEIAQNAGVASSSAQQAMEESSRSRSIVSAALKIVDELARDMGSTTDAIDRLKTETENIGNVLTVIRGIAEQTNLLALNAAIEAARAGEQGRGFAVVADEVRALAQKTQQSTEEINDMIDRLQSGASSAVNAMQNSLDKTQATVESSHQAESTLDAVGVAIDSINDMNSQIAVASEQQSHVAEEINVNVSNIATLSEENRENSEKVLQLSEELKTTGDKMRETASRFVV